MCRLKRTIGLLKKGFVGYDYVLCGAVTGTATIPQLG